MSIHKDPVDTDLSMSRDYTEEEQRNTRGDDDTIKENNMSVIPFDEDHIRHMLKKLHKKQHLFPQQLESTLLDYYNTILNYESILYGTPHYILLYSLIQEIFNDPRKYDIGTVGSHFKSCTDESSDVCDIPCLYGVKSPSRNSCIRPIIMSVYHRGKYSFRWISPIRDAVRIDLSEYQTDDNNDTFIPIIFIDINSKHRFAGFTIEEKNKLFEMGCQSKVRLVGYQDDHKKYIELSNNYIEIDSIATRFDIKCDRDYYYGYMVLGLFVFLFIVLVIFWALGGRDFVYSCIY